MTTRQEEVLNLSALYLHVYDKLYFFLDDPVKIFVRIQGRRKQARVVRALPPPPPPPFCVSYDVWFCLFTFHVFLTYRCSCGTMKTEFYVQPEFFSIFRGYPIQVNHSQVQQATGHCLSPGKFPYFGFDLQQIGIGYKHYNL